MRKFTHTFDHYELDNHRAIAVELHPQGWKSYGDLYENPIYYFNSFQYIGGDFYRALLGYESLWNRELEEHYVKALDFYLDWVCDREEYYFEHVTFTKPTKIEGLLWRRGIKPRRLSFKVKHSRYANRGVKALARVNVLDAPHHVDLEFFGTGEIYTVTLLQFLRWRDYGRMKFKPKPPSKQTYKKAESSNEREIQSNRRSESPKALVVKLPGLCPRERGAHSVREARQKAS